MRIVNLVPNNLQEFINYCKKYKQEHDESFLSDMELDSFNINDNPTVLLMDENNNITGAASLMLTKPFKENHKARFRILHSTEASIEAYKPMLEALLKDVNNIDYVYVFLPETKGYVGTIFKELGFTIERYSWVLKISNDEIKHSAFPSGFRVDPFVEGRDETIWCNIVNESFKNIAGHIDITADMINTNKDSEEYIENGMLVLWNEDKAVGLIQVSKDIEEGEECAYIGPIAILPEYQGKGLGRHLLRTGLELAQSSNFNFTILTVNGENSKAAELYLSEGFEKIDVFICYRMLIS